MLHDFINHMEPGKNSITLPTFNFTRATEVAVHTQHCATNLTIATYTFTHTCT